MQRAELFDAIAMAARPSPATVIVPAAPTVKPGPPQGPSRILLVEDSPDNRLLVRAYLKSQPYIVNEAENGEVAVLKFSKTSYDLVLMDLQMPVMDGLEATQLIRELERERAARPTPIIALTASALDEHARRCIAAGANTHLCKPVRKPVLLEAIRGAIGVSPASVSAPPERATG